MEQSFVLKGNICYSKTKDQLEIVPDGYVICEKGVCKGVFEFLPEPYANYKVIDYKNQLIIPGLIDLHIHAPQYSYRALGMDLELLDWLEKNTFPEESKFIDLDYAKKSYSFFLKDLIKGATTRASVFATLHRPATELLMDMFESSGLKAFVGKVNMDRNCPNFLTEENAETASVTTMLWIENTMHKYKNVFPILTPRFIPTCSDELMRKLSAIQKSYHLPLQSHLSENLSEIEFVKKLCPNSKYYGDAYDQFGLFGGDYPTIMAHCVHSDEEEIELLKNRGVFVAHCPSSNTNISSGIAPVRTYLDKGIPVGLGSDIAGGFSTSIFRAMSDAIQVSKLRWRLIDDSLKPLSMEEAFYLGTKGGGAFFGKVGSFEEGYEFDAVILDDSNLPSPLEFSVKERLERLIYLSDERNIKGKYVGGIAINLDFTLI